MRIEIALPAKVASASASSHISHEPPVPFEKLLSQLHKAVVGGGAHQVKTSLSDQQDRMRTSIPKPAPRPIESHRTATGAANAQQAETSPSGQLGQMTNAVSKALSPSIELHMTVAGGASAVRVETSPLRQQRPMTESVVKAFSPLKANYAFGFGELGVLGLPSYSSRSNSNLPELATSAPKDVATFSASAIAASQSFSQTTSQIGSNIKAASTGLSAFRSLDAIPASDIPDLALSSLDGAADITALSPAMATESASNPILSTKTRPGAAETTELSASTWLTPHLSTEQQPADIAANVHVLGVNEQAQLAISTPLLWNSAGAEFVKRAINLSKEYGVSIVDVRLNGSLALTAIPYSGGRSGGFNS